MRSLRKVKEIREAHKLADLLDVIKTKERRKRNHYPAFKKRTEDELQHELETHTLPKMYDYKSELREAFLDGMMLGRLNALLWVLGQTDDCFWDY